MRAFFNENLSGSSFGSIPILAISARSSGITLPYVLVAYVDWSYTGFFLSARRILRILHKLINYDYIPRVPWLARPWPARASQSIRAQVEKDWMRHRSFALPSWTDFQKKIFSKHGRCSRKWRSKSKCVSIQNWTESMIYQNDDENTC